MNIKLFYVPIIALIVSACTPSDRQGPENQAADIIFRGGHIYTVDARRSWAQAVAIKGNDISYVGTDDGAAGYIGPGTRVVDLQGRMMLPAFQDVHIHPVESGMDALAVDLVELETVEEYVAAIKRYAEEHPDEPWILGSGWSMAAFGPGGITNRKLIDDITGSIEAGKLADLIVLDKNLFELDQADISDTQVLLTLMEGEPVFGDLSAL